MRKGNPSFFNVGAPFFFCLIIATYFLEESRENKKIEKAKSKNRNL